MSTVGKEAAARTAPLYHKENKVGKGSFGQAFAGHGEGGTRVAIKQFSKSPEGSVEASEVDRNDAWAPASRQVILVLLLGGGVSLDKVTI